MACTITKRRSWAWAALTLGLLLTGCRSGIHFKLDDAPHPMIRVTRRMDLTWSASAQFSVEFLGPKPCELKSSQVNGLYKWECLKPKGGMYVYHIKKPISQGAAEMVVAPPSGAVEKSPWNAMARIEPCKHSCNSDSMVHIDGDAKPSSQTVVLYFDDAKQAHIYPETLLQVSGQPIQWQSLGDGSVNWTVEFQGDSACTTGSKFDFASHVCKTKNITGGSTTEYKYKATLTSKTDGESTATGVIQLKSH